MRIIVSWLAFFLIVLEVLLAFFLAVKAYFIVSVDEFGQVHDGLGRAVYEAPLLIKTFMRMDTWPGLIWTIVDSASFMSLIGIGYGLVAFMKWNTSKIIVVDKRAERQQLIAEKVRALKENKGN